MPRPSLLALQQALVDELTAPHHVGSGPRDRATALAGYDAERVGLLARLTQSKRLGKIARVLPSTFALLGADVPRIFPFFVGAHPLRSASGYRNAIQFYRFLRRGNRRGLVEPAWVVDLAACELAMASAARNSRPVGRWPRRGEVAIRRAAGPVLRTCAHDVRSLLDSRADLAPRVGVGRVHVAFVADAATGRTRALALEPEAFGLVRGLRRWQRIDRAVLKDGPSAGLLRALVSAGLLDVRPDRRAAGS